MRQRGSRRARLRRRRRDVDRRVPRRDQLRRGAALPAGRRRREQRLRLLDADREADARREQLVDKAIGYGIPGEQADGNDVLAIYEVTKRAVDRARARRGRDARRADDVPPEGPRRARQPVVRAGRRDRALGARRTIRSTATSQRLTGDEGVAPAELDGDRRARAARDRRRDGRGRAVADARAARLRWSASTPIRRRARRSGSARESRSRGGRAPRAARRARGTHDG